MLALTVVMRVILVARGGQHFFFDETKFGASTEAAALLSKGDVKGAVVFAVERHQGILGDHFGFKLIGIAPELLERRFGPNDHIPAYFFAAFSALSVLLLAAIAYRLSGSWRAFDLTLLAASLSATLLIYARFILPYDLSMCVALLGIWVGSRRPSGYFRSSAVGALGAWTFFCYYGYWPLAGTVLVVHALWLAQTPLGFAKRLGAAGLGGIGVVLAVVGISHLGDGGLFRDMAEIAGLQAGGPADFRASLNSWLYLFAAEKAGLVFWVAPFAVALFFDIRAWCSSGGRIVTPLTLAAAGYLVIFSIFVLNSDIRNTLIVCGRHMRQLAPFLILGFGLGMDRLCERSRFPFPFAAAVAVALVINSLGTFAIPLAQQFPRDFRFRAEALLKTLPVVSDGNSYYRLVNVDHYILEPEVLSEKPLATLLASPHPLLYVPYLYDSAPSRAEKKLRLSVDHRMRLVRMGVPAHERIVGKAYGRVNLSVVFPGARAGHSEPLLSVGPKGNGDLFFVDYVTPSTAALGYLNMGRKLIRSDPFEYSPGKPVELSLFCGALMPAEEDPISGLRPEVAQIFRQAAFATVDGHVLLDQLVARHLSQPGEVYAGINAVEADCAGDVFHGQILAVSRGGWPPEPKDIGTGGKYGPLHLKVAMPAASNGTAEPLVVTGATGHAVLGYARIFPDGSMCFGVEIWGIGAFEGKPVTLAHDSPIEVDYSFGSLYPEIGSPGWNDLPAARQQELKRTIRITVNGTVAFELEKDTPDLDNLPVVYGKNPVGGSLVNAGFSGQVLSGFRAAFGR